MALCSVCSYAQTDSTSNKPDTLPETPIATTPTTANADSTRVVTADSTSKKHKIFQPNPKKAGLYSAIFPGFGQIYNRQYWKVPVVYALLGVAGYFIVTNQSHYQEYRKAYIGRQTNDLSTETANTLLYTTNQLKTLQDGYKRYLDITVLLTGVGYTLQILDAVVFAHLKNFDISKDISMRLQPLAMPNGNAGVGFAFRMKPKSFNALPKEYVSPF